MILYFYNKYFLIFLINSVHDYFSINSVQGYLVALHDKLRAFSGHTFGMQASITAIYKTTFFFKTLLLRNVSREYIKE